MTVALIILAAGKGTRMKSDLPKVLHPVGGAPLLVHAMAAGGMLSPARTVVVAGHGADAVSAAAQAFDPEADVVIQTEQRGTAHAVAQARDALSDFDGDVVVLYGDTPFIGADTLRRMLDARAHHDVVVLGFEAADPGRYGRLIVKDGALDRIVEFKDATNEERAVTLCNSGVIASDAKVLFSLVDRVGSDNAANEFYLTDIVAMADSAGVVTCDEAETLGINSRSELAHAEALWQDRRRASAMDQGVTLPAPQTVFFSFDTALGQDVTIEPNVVFAPGVRVRDHATIRAFSHLEGCDVGEEAVIGPYARLRPGAVIGAAAKVGNFVEIKKANVGAGAKVNHLSYVGDATIGPAANLGAGTITCNYDGVFKHHTEIGARAFIGSNTMLVAPVSVGDDAMTASGSVITSNVPEGALALARGRQTNKPGLGRRLMDKLRAAKARQAKGKN